MQRKVQEVRVLREDAERDAGRISARRDWKQKCANFFSSMSKTLSSCQSKAGPALSKSAGRENKNTMRKLGEKRCLNPGTVVAHMPDNSRDVSVCTERGGEELGEV